MRRERAFGKALNHDADCVCRVAFSFSGGWVRAGSASKKTIVVLASLSVPGGAIQSVCICVVLLAEWRVPCCVHASGKNKGVTPSMCVDVDCMHAPNKSAYTPQSQHIYSS